MNLKLLLIVGAGGFIGSVSRFLLSRYVTVQTETIFPWGTLIVNLLGCFLIGLFFGIAAKNNLFNPDLRMFLTVGFCGGFTTFSTFANENLILFREGQILQAAIYTAVSVFFGILLTYAGHQLPKFF